MAGDSSSLTSLYSNLRTLIKKWVYDKTEVDNKLSNKESTSNKATQWSNSPDDSKYPSEKLVKDSLDNLGSNVNTAMTNLGSNVNTAMTNLGSNVSTAISTVHNRISNLNTSNILSSGEPLNNIGSYSSTVPQSTINSGINTQLENINTKISSLEANKHIIEATKTVDKTRTNLTINLSYLTTITDPSVDFSPLYIKLPNDITSTTNGVRFIIKYNNGNSTWSTQPLYDISGSSLIKENVLSANEIIIIGWDSNKLKLLKILGKEYSTVAETGSYNDLTDKPTIPTIPINVSAFNNDSGYLTAHQDISGKEDKSNKVTSISSSSTDTEYPSAKAVFNSLPSVPSASSVTPSADTTSGSVGNGTTWARSDHTHPKSSLYAEASHTHSEYVNPTIVDNLTTNDATKVLSAKQGKVLNDMIGDAIEYINQ